ncbi:helix-turn-helix domain-containing protein [Streptomyces spiralis]|uniref:helix-turn-helix domain-containing protein n=1 Tax=Streptomyces spiralis TaxID=66376 RepID=UPI00367A8649
MQELPDDDSWLPDQRRAIGDRVRAERERQKLTQEQVMLAARIDRVTLWRLETGHDLKLSTLQRVAFVLDVPLADFLRD